MIFQSVGFKPAAQKMSLGLIWFKPAALKHVIGLDMVQAFMSSEALGRSRGYML